MSYGVNLNVDANPRFDPKKFVEYSTDALSYDMLTSDFIKGVERLPVAGEVQIIVDEERLDNISYKLYGSTQYWWILALYNFMPCHKYAKKGIILRYFSLGELEKLNFSLKSER